jgi:hypothetical protein
MTDAAIRSPRSAGAVGPADVRADLGRVALAHLGLGLALVSVFTWIEPAMHPRHSGVAGIPMLIAALVITAVAVRLESSAQPVLRSLWGALGFAAAAFLAGATGIWSEAAGASHALTVAIAALVAAALASLLQARRASIGTVLAMGFAAAFAVTGLVGDVSDVDRASFAAGLFIVAVLFAAGALTGTLRPTITAGFVAVVAGLAAAAIVVAGDVDVGPALLAVAMLLVVAVAILPVRVPSVIGALAVGEALVIALVAREWGADNWYAAGPAVGGVMAFVLAVRAERRSTVPLRMGGAYALSALLVVFGGEDLGVSHPAGQDIVGAVTLLVLAVAAAHAHRPLITAVAVLELVFLGAGRFAASSAGDRHVQEAIFIVVGLLVLVAASRMRPVSGGEVPARE